MNRKKESRPEAVETQPKTAAETAEALTREALTLFRKMPHEQQTQYLERLQSIKQ